MSKTIVCLGDSNTWGYDPRGFGGGRWPDGVRWTARLNARPEWIIHNLGENGRAIPHTPFELRTLCGQLAALRPFDGLCVMLGSNDLLLGVPPAGVAARMERLLGCLPDFGAPLLLIAPPCFQSGDWVREEALLAASERLAGYYRPLAGESGAAFADAGRWDIPLCFDGVHFTAEGHARFAAQAGGAFAAAFCKAE